MAFIASEWGTANQSLTDPPAGGYAASEWGTASKTLADPEPDTGWLASEWGTANKTLVEPAATTPTFMWDGDSWVAMTTDILEASA